MPVKHPIRLSKVFLITGSCLLLWIVAGHFYRPPIEKQTTTSNDGVSEYRFECSVADTFDPELYENTGSVEEAVQYIEEHYQPKTEKQYLLAVYDFTRKRYMHFMYPHHSWLTNPYPAVAEVILPKKPYNGMYLADDVLRHSAVAPCGGAANTFGHFE